jgi:hypothetical protein
VARVLIISDTQAPFHHPKAVQFFKQVYKIYDCDKVVHIGDEVDNKFLKFASINDPHTAQQQHDMALTFMRHLYKAFPKVKVCNSNHGDRLLNATDRAGIPEFFLKSIHDYMQAPKGWEWGDKWIIDGVHYEHGTRFGGKYLG